MIEGAKNAVIGLVVIMGAIVLGGILGGFADVWVGGLITGTPLGYNSSLSPILWTGIALFLIGIAGRQL